MRADINSPQQTIDFFKKFNFPPIFKHVSISEDMIGEKMASLCKQKGKKFPTDPVLTTVFHAKQHLLTTEMALFLKECGCEITNVTLVVEYQKDTAFKDFIDSCTNQRIAATEEGDEIKASISKLKANS